MRRLVRTIVMAAAAAIVLPAMLAAHAGAQAYQPPGHNLPPPFLDVLSPEEIGYFADLGLDVERDRKPADLLAEHRRLDRALAALQPQRKGVVDAYVVAVALDSDPVFGREAREAERVLARRYDAAGRSVVLAGSDGRAASTLPMGSPDAIAATLARVAELMDPAEDVLVLYTTSHGAPLGIVYNDGDQGFGAISPTRLWSMLSQLGIRNRMILISACYAGIFVPRLQSDTSVIVTAADAEHTSFGCQADMDWTFFGDALVNHALRRPQPLADAAREAQALIGGWEKQGRLTPSGPTVSIGSGVARWLAPLETRMPKGTTAMVGRPAVSILAQLQH